MLWRDDHGGPGRRLTVHWTAHSWRPRIVSTRAVRTCGWFDVVCGNELPVRAAGGIQFLRRSSGSREERRALPRRLAERDLNFSQGKRINNPTFI